MTLAILPSSFYCFYYNTIIRLGLSNDPTAEKHISISAPAPIIEYQHKRRSKKSENISLPEVIFSQIVGKTVQM